MRRITFDRATILAHTGDATGDFSFISTTGKQWTAMWLHTLIEDFQYRPVHFTPADIVADMYE